MLELRNEHHLDSFLRHESQSDGTQHVWFFEELAPETLQAIADELKKEEDTG